MMTSGCIVCSLTCSLKAFDFEAQVAREKNPDHRMLIGHHAARRLGDSSGALARRALKMSDLANDDGYKLTFTFLHAKGFAKKKKPVWIGNIWPISSTNHCHADQDRRCNISLSQHMCLLLMQRRLEMRG